MRSRPHTLQSSVLPVETEVGEVRSRKHGREVRQQRDQRCFSVLPVPPIPGAQATVWANPSEPASATATHAKEAHAPVDSSSILSSSRRDHDGPSPLPRVQPGNLSSNSMVEVGQITRESAPGIDSDPGSDSIQNRRHTHRSRWPTSTSPRHAERRETRTPLPWTQLMLDDLEVGGADGRQPVFVG